MLRYNGLAISPPYAAEVGGDVHDSWNDAPQQLHRPRDFVPKIVVSSPSPVDLAPTLVRKLQRFARLEAADIDALSAISETPKTLRAGHILVSEGYRPGNVFLIEGGMACRYKLLPNGQRQILGFLIPGDLCDIHFARSGRPDHSVALLSNSQIVKIPERRIAEMLAAHPRIERALALAEQLDVAILREWLLNVGQRNALQKLSHFFCEMHVRLDKIGLVDDDGSFDLPVNQSALADTTGLTPVHINRTLQRLRNDGLVRLHHRRLLILDHDRLAATAGFDDEYLQFQQCKR